MVKPVSFALLRPVAMMLVAFSLVGGLVGGLIRAGAVSTRRPLGLVCRSLACRADDARLLWRGHWH